MEGELERPTLNAEQIIVKWKQLFVIAQHNILYQADFQFPFLHLSALNGYN